MTDVKGLNVDSNNSTIYMFICLFSPAEVSSFGRFLNSCNIDAANHSTIEFVNAVVAT